MGAKFHLSADQLVAVQQKKILYRLLTWITYIEQYLSIGNMPKELSDEVSEGLEYLKGCSINSDFGMLLQIEVSFRLLLVFCGVFLSSFSVT